MPMAKHPHDAFLVSSDASGSTFLPRPVTGPRSSKSSGLSDAAFLRVTVHIGDRLQRESQGLARLPGGRTQRSSRGSHASGSRARTVLPPSPAFFRRFTFEQTGSCYSAICSAILRVQAGLEESSSERIGHNYRAKVTGNADRQLGPVPKQKGRQERLLQTLTKNVFSHFINFRSLAQLQVPGLNNFHWVVGQT